MNTCEVPKIKLLDVSLPEKSISNILAILQTNNMSIVRIPDNPTGHSFNCWGFVAYYCAWEQAPVWLREEVMEVHLRERAVPIRKDEATTGDIAVFRDDWENLRHTAIVMPDASIICHKPGATALCIDTVKTAERGYGKATFMRPKTKEDLTKV